MTSLSTSPLLFKTAGILGLISLTAGILGLAKPSSGWTIFSFPRPASAEAQKVGETFFLFWASRDVFMGLMTSVAWYTGDRKMMGYALLSAGMVAGVDGVISLRQCGGGQWKHWSFLPVLGALGGGLVGWFD